MWFVLAPGLLTQRCQLLGREAHKYLGVHWPWQPALNDFCLNPHNNAANFKAQLRLQKSQDNNWSTSEVLLRPKNLSFKRTLGSNQCILVPAEGTAVAAGLATCPGQGEVAQNLAVHLSIQITKMRAKAVLQSWHGEGSSTSCQVLAGLPADQKCCWLPCHPSHLSQSSGWFCINPAQSGLQRALCS